LRNYNAADLCGVEWGSRISTVVVDDVVVLTVGSFKCVIDEV